MQSILVIGATGVLGSAATQYFLKQGFAVKCFVRNKQKAKELEQAGATIFVGDLTDESSLKDACKDVDILITAAHAMLGKGKNSSSNIDEKAHKALVAAAVEAGVRQFIYPSINGVSANHPVDFWRHKFSVEQHLIHSGLNYTILRLPAFMETHVHMLLGRSIIEKNKVMILGRGINPTNFIAVDDVVKAVGVIAGNQGYFKKIIKIAGPQNLSRNEVAAAYARSLNVTPKVGHVPVGALKFLSKIIKPFHPGIARVIKFSVYTDTSDETMNTNESIEQFGLQPTTVDEFIVKQLGRKKQVKAVGVA